MSCAITREETTEKYVVRLIVKNVVVSLNEFTTLADAEGEAERLRRLFND